MGAQTVEVKAEVRMLREAREGSERAFDALFGPLAEAAYRLALAMLRDPGEAEDVVQEAALKAWRKLGQLRPGHPVRPWFLAIVANQCRSVRRTRWWSTLRMSEPPAPAAATEEAAIQHSDLRRAFRHLGAEDRLALYLFFSLDLPLPQAAAVMGLSVPAARSRIYRALKRMRPGLELREAI
jgi:RNA polymerase sigma-70 factor (ECF subfamily)